MLIGDAAHLMSPFSGAGANLAMVDGLNLGLVLSALAQEGKLGHVEAVDKAVAAFEEDMMQGGGVKCRDPYDGNPSQKTDDYRGDHKSRFQLFECSATQRGHRDPISHGCSKQRSAP